MFTIHTRRIFLQNKLRRIYRDDCKCKLILITLAVVSACVARDTGGRTCAASGLDRYAARDPSGVPIRLGAGGIDRVAITQVLSTAFFQLRKVSFTCLL